MVFSIKRLALPLGLTISLVSAFTPLGCGSSGEAFAPVGPTHGDAEVPAPVAQRLTACAREHRDHLREPEHSVSFDVGLTNDGDVDSVAVKDSTLGDQDLEACMAGALRALSADDLPMRHSGSVPRDPVAPESRAPLGQAQALTCLASPPCALVVFFLIGAATITVQIYAHAASQASTAKPKPRTAPTATTMPTATTEDDEDDPCMALMVECLENKKQPAWNVKDYGPEKNCLDCYRNCKFHSKPRGTWPDKRCPRN